MLDNNITAKITWKTVESIQELISLKEQWQLLYVKQQNMNPFCCPQWLLSWYEVYWQKNWSLKVLVGFIDDELIAFIPTYVQRAKHWPFLTTMRFLGQGEAEDIELATEYLDILIEPHNKIIALPYIQNWFKLKQIDLICWDAILTESTINEIFLNIEGTKRTEASRFIINSQNWSVNKLSKNTRKRINKNNNKLKKVSTELKWLNKEELETYWPIMISFHQKRWQAEGKKGAFTSTEFYNFHKSILNSNDQITPLFSVLLVNNKAAAIHYYLVIGDTLHFYQSGWDSISMANYSPGLSLHIWSIKNNPYLYYDFMMGNKSDSYKSQFKCSSKVMFNIKTINHPFRLLLHKLINKLTIKISSNKGI